jgi:hypothetical protein
MTRRNLPQLRVRGAELWSLVLKACCGRTVRGFRRFLVLLVILLLAGCVSARNPPPQPASSNLTDGHGYALLYDLLGDEKDAAKLRFIKRERPELKELVNEISARCREAHQRLEAFGKADRSLNLKNLGLPADEVAARKAISRFKEKALLTEKGKDFEVQLLLSQNEALTYGAHLAKISITCESRPDRVEFLRQLSSDLLRLQQKLFEIVLANYAWPAKP